MTHLFLFTLGPVQGFIAQARKTHDLHSGSKLLSELCWVAAKHFESLGGKIIFPKIEEKPRSIPNRFLGKIEAPDDQLAEIGKVVAQAVQDDWKKRFDYELAELLDPAVYRAAKHQIEQHLDIQWLFQPLENDKDEVYRAAYDEINKKLNALKNTRPFKSMTETGRKCSLNGERNVIFYRKSEGQKAKPTADMQNGNPLYSSENVVLEYDDTDDLALRHLQPGEGLSAVSMLKRAQNFGSADFPSTAEFALAETMQQVGQTILPKMTDLFEKSAAKYLNWQVFFEENLNERYFQKQGLPTGKTLEDAEKIQEQFQKSASENGRKLEKYYALVIFDGDHMGEWWKGEHLKEGVSLENFHADLTNQLAEFADQVREKYENSREGWVIYAGGDDFMGFFNLHHLLNGLEFLQKTYRDTVDDKLSSQIKPGKTLTFSAGVCIAHYKEPLSLVLSETRELEKKAKNLRDEKNAIGIGVIPGSGQIATAILPFEKFSNFSKIEEALRGGDFSNAFVSKARAELESLADRDGKINVNLRPVAERLLDRAVSRACNPQKLEGESPEDLKKRKDKMIADLQAEIRVIFDAEKLSNFLDALDIADFIERQTHISELKNPESVA